MLSSRRMIARAGDAALKGEPEQSRRIAAVHGAPAVVAFADIGRVTLLAGNRDQLGYEPGVAVTVNGRSEPDNRSAHAERARAPPSPR